MPKLVISSWLLVHGKKHKTKKTVNSSATNYELPTNDQKGYSQIILPLFLLAAIGLSVYLVQQRTNITPFAQTAPPATPNGCSMITMSVMNNNKRWVKFQDAADIALTQHTAPEYEMPSRPNNFNGGTGKDLRKFEFKDVEFEFESNGKYRYGMRKKKGYQDIVKEDKFGIAAFEQVEPGNWDQYFKCENVGYDAGANKCITNGTGTGLVEGKLFQAASMSHFDRPDIQEYWLRTPGGQKFTVAGTREAPKQDWQSSNQSFDGGRYYVFTTYQKGTNDVDEEGVPGIIGDGSGDLKQNHPDKIYAFVPTDPNNKNVRCDPDVASGGGTGTKNTGDSCTNGPECKSGTCSNLKCAASGSKVGGDTCTDGPECQSGICSNKQCTGGSVASGKACNSNSECASNKCGTDNKCTAVTSNPTNNKKNNTSGGGGNGGGTSSPSPSPAASPSSAASPVASASGGSTVVSLTKAEITNFKKNFDALYAVLGTTKDTGNLKIVSTIANNELNSIVSELDTCPNDANVGKCIDDKFRTRFDLAKTAARLSAFYAIFNSVPSVCVKADLGLNPLITSTNGRVMLCNDRLVASKVWMVFENDRFTPILTTDTRFPPNPTCTTLPDDVVVHFRNAEKLFENQAGFVKNTNCDGKSAGSAPATIATSSASSL